MDEQGENKKIQVNTRKFVTQKEIDQRMEEYLKQFRPKKTMTYYDPTVSKDVDVYEARHAAGSNHHRGSL